MRLNARDRIMGCQQHPPNWCTARGILGKKNHLGRQTHLSVFASNESRFPYQYWHTDAEHSQRTPAPNEMIRMRMAIRGKSICRDKENCNLLCHGTTQQGFAEADFLQPPKTKANEKNAVHGAHGQMNAWRQNAELNVVPIQHGDCVINYSAVEYLTNGKKTHASGERTTLLTIYQRLTDKKIIGKTIYHFFPFVEDFACVANEQKKREEEALCGPVFVAHGAREGNRVTTTDTHIYSIGIYFSVCFYAHHSAFHMHSVKIAQTYNIQPTNRIRRRDGATEKYPNVRTISLITFFSLPLCWLIDGIVLSFCRPHTHTEMANMRHFYCVKTYLF